MNHDEQQQQYALDTLLHPDGKPWEWWQFLSSVTSTWRDCQDALMWHTKKYYRRKSTAPDWSKELSPKEVAECDDWPSGYEMTFGRDDVVLILYCGAEIWNSEDGWRYKNTTHNEILDHFKDLREVALQRMPVVDEYCEQEQKIATCDHKPSKDEILRDEAIARFTEKATSKFNAGIQEHNPNGGNDLEDRATFADLEDEIIDLWYYVQGLKRRIHRT